MQNTRHGCACRGSDYRLILLLQVDRTFEEFDVVDVDGCAHQHCMQVGMIEGLRVAGG